MKKAYEAPSIEKIAFNYRDQVVATSGVKGTSGIPSEDPTIGDLIGRFANGLGNEYCDEIGGLVDDWLG